MDKVDIAKLKSVYDSNSSLVYCVFILQINFENPELATFKKFFLIFFTQNSRYYSINSM